MRLLSILLGLLLLTACVPPSDTQLRMEMDLQQMKRRLAQLEVQKTDAVTSGSAEGDQLQRQVAELEAGLDNLRVEYQSINGRLDDLNRDNRQIADDLQLIKDDVGLQLSSLLSSVEELEQRPVTAATVSPPAVAESLKAPEETAEQLYQRALDKIRKEERFAEGRQLLETFSAKYPQHELYVNALYWSGEALYGEKKYELAILQLQDVISKYAKHPKAPAAMLKQGLAFNALGDGQNARTTMQKLLDEYPDSAQAKMAKKFLEQ